MHGWNRSRVAASFFHPPPMKNKGLEGKKKKAKTRQCLSPPPLCELSAFPKPVPVSRAKLQFGNYGFAFLPAEKQQHEVPDSSHWNLGRPESGIGLPNVFSSWCLQHLAVLTGYFSQGCVWSLSAQQQPARRNYLDLIRILFGFNSHFTWYPQSLLCQRKINIYPSFLFSVPLRTS